MNMIKANRAIRAFRLKLMLLRADCYFINWKQDLHKAKEE